MSEAAKAVNVVIAENPVTAENVQGRIDVGRALGSSETAMYLYDIAPGAGSCPYHYEYEEEWLLVVSGSVVIRRPDGEQVLEQGDVVRFPVGPDGAHKIMNRSSSPARTLMFGSTRTPSIVVYPDSDKVGVFSGDPADDYFLLRGGAVSWAHGEEGWNRAD